MAEDMDINPGTLVQCINDLDTAHLRVQQAHKRCIKACDVNEYSQDLHFILRLNGDAQPLAKVSSALQNRFPETDTAVSDWLDVLHQLRQHILASAAESHGALANIEIPA